jgi:hypothetical protein
MREPLRWRAFRHASRAWNWWERFTLWLVPVTPVRPGSIFTVHLRGGGEILELHLDSRELNRRRSAGASAFALMRVLREDLATLADRIRGGEFSTARLLWARSLVGGAGGVLGFQTRPLPHTVVAALHQYVLVGLDAINHPRGLRRRAMKRWPVETTISVEDLLRRYPAKSERSTVAR